MGTSLTEHLVPQIEPPSVPTNDTALGVPVAVVEHLVIKHISAYPKIDLIELSHRLCVVSHIVEDALAQLRKRSWIEVYQPVATLSESSYAQVRYGLTELGMAEAELAFRRDAYIGPVPVSMEQYWQVVQAQDLRRQPIGRADVERALSDVYGSERLVQVLGPAINSGRAMLLYGHAGTGKSYVAARVLNALNTSVSEASGLRQGAVCISTDGERHLMLCANPIATADIYRLREKLEPLRNMSLDEIKQAYKVTLRAETPEDSKGAGLGFLTMARDASAPLEFDFHPRADDPDTTLFCLKATI